MGPFTRKNKIPSYDLANVLYGEFVCNMDADKKTINRLNLKENQKLVFQTRMISCRLAIVLMALVAIEEKNSRFLKVHECFEKIISDKTIEIENSFREITAKGLGKEISINFRIDIQQSLVALKVLLHSDKNKYFSWAAKWFQDLNIEVVNPVDLTMLCMVFMDGYILVHKTLENSDPV